MKKKERTKETKETIKKRGVEEERDRGGGNSLSWERRRGGSKTEGGLLGEVVSSKEQ